MHSKTKDIVFAALMAAVVCVMTMIIKIPSPLKGYVNLGDGAVLLSAWMLSAPYAFFAAGVGSALADLFSGYAIYAPATFLIKGSMALVAFVVFKFMKNRIGKLPSQLVGALFAEVVMIIGYFVFEGCLYGFSASLVNMPANLAQGIAGIVIGVVLVKIMERINFTKS